MGIMFPSLGAPSLAGAEEAPALAFAAFLDGTEVAFDTAVEIEAWSRSRGGLVTIRLSFDGLLTDPGDAPANAVFRGRLQQVTWARRTSGRRFGGESEFKGGTIRFSIADRAMMIDGTSYGPNTFLDDLAVDGQAVRVRGLPPGTRFRDGIKLFTGTAKGWSRSSGASIDLEMRGSAWRLDVPLSGSTFLGTGGLDGGPELEGKRKPVLFGAAFNFVPVPLIAGELLYCWHYDGDGNRARSYAVPTVRVGGVPLGFSADYATAALLRAATIAPGHYATCLAESLMRLGDDPLAPVTMDAQGAVVSGVYAELPGAVLKVAATLYGAKFAASEIDSGSFGNLDVSRPWPIHRWFGPEDSTTVSAFFDEVMGSIEGAWGDRPTGELQVYAIAVAVPGTGAPVVSLSSRDIRRDSFAREPLPADVAPAIREVTIGYQRNLAPTGDLPELVQGEARSRLQTEWLTVTGSQTLTAHPLANQLRIDTLLTTKTAAEAFAAFLLDLYDGRKARVSMIASHKALGLDIAQRTELSLESEQLGAPRPGRVLGLEPDLSAKTWRLDLLLTPPGRDFSDGFDEGFS